MGVWAWLRPGDRIWKVISDYEKGTLSVYDENGNLILEKKGLTREVMELVEKNFLDVTATNLDARSSEKEEEKSSDSHSNEQDPMFA